MTTPTADVRHGILKAWDLASYTATVQFTGSLMLYVATIAVSRNIPNAEMITGRKVAVAFFDPSNSADAVLFAVYT